MGCGPSGCPSGEAEATRLKEHGPGWRGASQSDQFTVPITKETTDGTHTITEATVFQERPAG